MWGAVAEFAAKAMSWWLERTKQKNAPDVKARAKAQDELDAQARAERAIRERRLEELRRLGRE